MLEKKLKLSNGIEMVIDRFDFGNKVSENVMNEIDKFIDRNINGISKLIEKKFDYLRHSILENFIKNFEKDLKKRNIGIKIWAECSIDLKFWKIELAIKNIMIYDKLTKYGVDFSLSNVLFTIYDREGIKIISNTIDIPLDFELKKKILFDLV